MLVSALAFRRLPVWGARSCAPVGSWAAWCRSRVRLGMPCRSTPGHVGGVERRSWAWQSGHGWSPRRRHRRVCPVPALRSSSTVEEVRSHVVSPRLRVASRPGTPLIGLGPGGGGGGRFGECPVPESPRQDCSVRRGGVPGRSAAELSSTSCRCRMAACSVWTGSPAGCAIDDRRAFGVDTGLRGTLP